MSNSFRHLISDDQDNSATGANSIRTPKRQTSGNGSNVEFTPIGSVSEADKLPSLQFGSAQLTNTRFSEQSSRRIPKLKNSYVNSSYIASQQDTEMLQTLRKQSKPLHRVRIDNNGYESATSGSAFDESDIDDNSRAKKPALFGGSVIRDGSNVLPSFDLEKVTSIVDGEESNMVKKQTELLQQLKADNMNLKVELQTWKSLPRDHEKLAQQIVILRQQMLSLQVENGNLKKVIQSNNDSNENIDVEELNEQINDFKDQLDEKDHMYQTVRDEKDDLVQDKIKLTDEIDILNNRIDQYEFKIRNLENDRNISGEQSERVSQLQRDIEKLEHSIDSLEKENNNLVDENHELRTEIDQLEQQIDQDNDFHQLENLKSELEIKIEDLNQALDSRESEIELLKKEKSALKHEKNQLELKLDVMEAKQATIPDQTSDKRLEDITNKLIEASESIDQMELEIDNKDQIIQNLSSNVKELNSRIDNLVDDREKLEETINQYRKNEDQNERSSSDNVNEIYSKLRKLQDENRGLNNTIKSLESDLRKNMNFGTDAKYLEDLESDKEVLHEALHLANKKLEEEVSIRKILEAKLKGDNDIDGAIYDDIEKLRNKIENERDVFEDEISKLSDAVRTLVDERDDALNQLDKVEEEKNDLIEDFETIQREYRSIKKLEDSKDLSIDSLKDDIEKLSIQYRLELDSHATTKMILNSQIDNLKTEIGQRDLQIVSLKSKLSDALNSSDKDLKSSKLIDELSNKVKVLVNERDDLVKQKNKLDEILNTTKGEMDQLKFKSQNQTSLISDLEKNLESLNKERRLLKKQLSVQTDDISDLISAIEALKIQSTKISEGMDEIIHHEDKLLENNEKIFKSFKAVDDKNDALAKLSSQLESSYNDYNDLRNTLLKKIENIRDERNKAKNELISAQGESSSWKSKSESLERRLKSLENSIEIEKAEKLNLINKLRSTTEKSEWYPPTPISPSKRSENVVKKLELEVEVCELQKQLLAFKLQETTELYDDQAYQNKYLQVEIDSKNETIMKNYKLVRESGIAVPSKDKQIKFSDRSKLRIAFLTVLAFVRMRNRLHEAQNRKNQIQMLKKDIIKRKHLLENDNV